MFYILKSSDSLKYLYKTYIYTQVQDKRYTFLARISKNL